MRMFLLGCAAVVLVAGGCAGPVSSTGSTSEGNATAPKQPSGDLWRGKLAAERVGPSIGFAGRRFQKVERTLNDVTYYGPTRLYLQYGTPFAGLRDADTGEDILPVDFQEIFLISNLGVLVLLPDDRVELHRNWERSIAGHRKSDEPLIPRRYYARLDPATNKLVKTDIRYVTSHYARPGMFSHVVLRDAIARDAGSVDRYSADFLSPEGQLTLALPRLQLQGPHMAMQLVAGFGMVKGSSPDDKPLNYLLTRSLEPIYVSDSPIQTFSGVKIEPNGQRQTEGAPDDRKFFAIPATGRSPDEDLWLLLDAGGRFSAPDGAVGFRPLYDGYRGQAPSSVDSWLVLYDRGAGADTPRWAWADSKLTSIPAPRYADVRLVMPPMGAGELGGPYSPEERKPFLMLREGGQWRSAQPVVPAALPVRSPQGPIEVRGDDFAMVRDATLSGLAKWPAARQAKAAAEAALQQELIRIRQQGNWEEAVRTRNGYTMGSMIWNRPADDWYTYALHVPMATPELYEQAAGRVTNPDFAQRLREMATRARATQARLQAESASYAAARLSAERSAAESRVSSSGWSGSYGNYSSGSVSSWTGGSDAQQMANYRRQLDSSLNAVTGKPSWAAWNPR